MVSETTQSFWKDRFPNWKILH